MKKIGGTSNGYEKLQTQQPQVNGHHPQYVAKKIDKESYVNCYEVTVQSNSRPTPPKAIFFALITLIACFCIGTPLSLLCTVPAYILADKAEVLKSHGEISKAKRFITLSIILCVAATILGIMTTAASFIVYNYIVYPDEFHS